MRNKILLAAIIFCFVGINLLYAGGKYTADAIQEKYLSAREHFRKGEYEAAIKGFEEVVKMDPHYRVASEYLKTANEKLKAKAQKESAASQVKEARESDAKKRQVHKETNLAKVREGWQKWLDKEKEKSRVRGEKKKENARIKREKEIASYYGLDELEHLTKKVKDMMAKAEEKIVLEENKEKERLARIESFPSPKRERSLADIYMGRAEAAYKDGNYEEAVKEWEKAGAADPGEDKAAKHIEQVRAMVEKNKQAEFGKARKESAAEAADAVAKYCYRGKYLYRHRDYKGSVEEYQKVLAIDPDNKEAKNVISKVQQKFIKKNLREKGIYDKQVEKISKLLGKGNAYLAENKFEKARKYALKALEIDPDNVFARQLLENAEKGLGKK